MNDSRRFESTPPTDAYADLRECLLKTRSLVALAAVVLLILVAGVALLYAARPQALPNAVTYTLPPELVVETVAPSPTVAAATAAATASGAPSPVFAASECTSATATTRQVIERYFALSTSNNAQAVTDCFAQSWRDKSPQYAAGSELWSHSGPANNLIITPVDTVNGCDRFRVTAQMPNNRFWTGGQVFFSVGFEAGRMRIYESGSALLNASNTTLRCG